ncbi:MAG: fumarylacetoacetate hydrolase family protein [Anaerolineae bacterium]|nr:fumarylacetoacetate hydrolase family protein [Anaerolineae bacterium]
MRLATFIQDGRWRLGAIVGDEIIDLASAHDARLGGYHLPSDMRSLLEAGPDAWSEVERTLASGDLAPFARPLTGVKLTAPIPNPSKIVAVGQNYMDHVKEQGAEIPDHPIIFTKFPTSVIGPDDEIRWDPGLTSKVDWEVELAVVIGREARRVPADRAYEYVFGYTIANDVSARDLQFADGQWVRGKSLDTFCPLGPWIVTWDEIPDPHELPLRCLVNGEVVQDSCTDQMIFQIPHLIEFLSRAFTLLPGDVILTGTPPGVGHFRTPPRYLQDGDIVTVEIEEIGALTNSCHTQAQ